MREIRSHRSTQQMLNGENPTNDEGGAFIATRCTSFAPGTKYSQKGDDSKAKDTNWTPWRIPPLPDGFKSVMPAGLFKRLEAWRKFAHGSTTHPRELQKQFAVQRSPEITRGQNPKRRACCSGTDSNEDDADLTSIDTNGSQGPRQFQILSAHKRICRGRDGCQVMAYNQVSSFLGSS